MYVRLSPQKGALLHMGKKIRSPSTEPHAGGRPTYNGVRPGSPRGSFTTLLSLPQSHAAFGTIPSTLSWIDPQKGIPYKPVTAYHVTQGGVDYESTTLRDTDEGLDLWEACNRIESLAIISFLVHAGIGAIIELLIHI